MANNNSPKHIDLTTKKLAEAFEQAPIAQVLAEQAEQNAKLQLMA